MTRDRAMTVKAGDRVTYQYPDNLIEVRQVYDDESVRRALKDDKGCTVGAVIENHNKYEIHQRVTSKTICPFEVGDKVMSNGHVLSDPEIGPSIKEGMCLSLIHI